MAVVSSNATKRNKRKKNSDSRQGSNVHFAISRGTNQIRGWGLSDVNFDLNSILNIWARALDNRAQNFNFAQKSSKNLKNQKSWKFARYFKIVKHAYLATLECPAFYSPASSLPSPSIYSCRREKLTFFPSIHWDNKKVLLRKFCLKTKLTVIMNILWIFMLHKLVENQINRWANE